jgi:hypothetical protein
MSHLPGSIVAWEADIEGVPLTVRASARQMPLPCCYLPFFDDGGRIPKMLREEAQNIKVLLNLASPTGFEPVLSP